MFDLGQLGQVLGWAKQHWLVISLLAVCTSLIWLTDLVGAVEKVSGWLRSSQPELSCRYLLIDGYDLGHDFDHANFSLGDARFYMDSSDLWRPHVVLLKGFDRGERLAFAVSMARKNSQPQDYVGVLDVGASAHFRLTWPKQVAETTPATATEVTFRPVGENEAARVAGEYWGRRAGCAASPNGVVVTR